MAKRLWMPERDLPVLVEHWDANSGIILQDGNVRQWIGKFAGIAANADNGTPPLFSATALNGEPGVYFDPGRAYLTFKPTGFPTGNQASVVAISAALNSYADSGYAYAFGFGDNGSYRQRTIGASNGGRITVTMADADAVTGQPWAGLNQFVTATFRADTNLVAFVVDGVDLGAIDLNATPNTGSAQGCIGSFVGYPLVWSGWIQQILVFSRELTFTERQLLEGWESWYTGKAGANLPADHPYKLAAPTVEVDATPGSTRPATPLDLDVKPLYYFDNSDASSLTVASNGKVTQRLDVSGRGVVASNTQVNNSPELVPASADAFALPAVSYNGGQYDQAAVSLSGTEMTAIAVLQPRGIGGYARFMAFGQPGLSDYNTDTSFDIEMDGGNLRFALNRALNKTDWVPFGDGQRMIIEVVWKDGLGRLFVNGREIMPSISFASALQITTAVFGASTTAGDSFSGIQAAHLLWDTALSDDDRARVRGALAWKWDGGIEGPLVSALPAKDPFKYAAPTVATGVTTPTPATARRRRLISLAA